MSKKSKLEIEYIERTLSISSCMSAKLMRRTLDCSPTSTFLGFSHDFSEVDATDLDCLISCNLM